MKRRRRASSGSVSLDATRAFSGTKSLHLASHEAGACVQVFQSFIGLPTNAFYGRRNIWFDSWPRPNQHSYSMAQMPLGRWACLGDRDASA